MVQFKDLFSKQANAYAQYRPDYPHELYNCLLKSCGDRGRLWDCGSGNGQVAVALSPYFEQVIATDLSQKQLDAATTRPNIEYRLATAENSGLADASCDAISVAQALHWFDFDAFHREVSRVLKPEGVIAVWCYQHFNCQQVEIDIIFKEFYHYITAEYWAPERRHVDEAYANIPFPYQDVSTHHLEIKRSWTLDAIINYISTWSSINSCRQTTGRELIDEWLKPRLVTFDRQKPIDITWPLIMHIGRVGQ